MFSYCINFSPQSSLIVAYFEAGLKVLVLVLHHMHSSAGVTVEQDCSDPERLMS